MEKQWRWTDADIWKDWHWELHWEIWRWAWSRWHWSCGRWGRQETVHLFPQYSSSQHRIFSNGKTSVKSCWNLTFKKIAVCHVWIFQLADCNRQYLLDRLFPGGKIYEVSLKLFKFKQMTRCLNIVLVKIYLNLFLNYESK